MEQYARLGDALIHGRTNLDLPVPLSLKQLMNPYDPDMRNTLSNGGRTPMCWDHAFFHGKYYSYFGVIPAVILYMPYQLITGRWLSTSVAVLIFSSVSVMGLAWLIIMMGHKLFPATASLGMTLALIPAATLGNSLIYQLSTPNFYSIPGVSSLAFTNIGLGCWLAAKRDDGSINPWLIGLGSLCIAATLGCRPQFAIAAFLAFPLFWNEIAHTRLFFSIRGIGNTLAAIIPFLCIAIPLGWYNYIRFGSALNIGSSYNLTGFDMTNTHLPTRNILLVLWYVLFQPSNLTVQFPFVALTQTPLPIWSPAEFSVGGLFAISPFLIITIFVPWLIPRIQKPIKTLACSTLVLGVFIAIFDAALTGFAWRYFLDCAWLFVIATALAFFTCDHVELSSQTSRSENISDLSAGTLLDTSNIKFSSTITPSLVKALRLFLIGAILCSAIFQFLRSSSTNVIFHSSLKIHVTISPLHTGSLQYKQSVPKAN